MLDHLQFPEAADELRRGVAKVLSSPDGPRTPDLGGTASTNDVGQAVLTALGS